MSRDLRKLVIPMDNLNHGNESDAIREKANALKEMVMQNAESSATGGRHLPPARKKRGERKTNAIFEKAVTRSRMTADEYRAALVAEAESKAKEEARLAAEAKAKEEALAMEELKRRAEAEAKAQAEEIERLKAQAAAEAAAREEELARVRAEAEEEVRRQAEEAARQAREEAEEAARKAREEAAKAEAEATPEITDIPDNIPEDESFEEVNGIFDKQEEVFPDYAPTDIKSEAEIKSEIEVLDEDVFVIDNASSEPVDESASVEFDEEKPVFDEESPVFEESEPVFEEELPEEVKHDSKEESIFEEETPIFEEQDLSQADENGMIDEDDGEAADQTESDDFGFAIDTMTKSESATELKYDHTAFRTRRKRLDGVKTTDIPWVIPGNVQENASREEIDEVTPEVTPEPEEAEESVQSEQAFPVQKPVVAESRSEREERDVLSLLNEYEANNEAVDEEKSKTDDKSEIIESETSFSEDADNRELENKVDELFETDDIIDANKDDSKTVLVSSEDLKADAVSANTMFETESMDNASPQSTVEPISVKTDDLFEETLFTEMEELPKSNDDLFETESIEDSENRMAVPDERSSAESPLEKEKVSADKDELTSETESETDEVSSQSFDDLFSEETIADDTDRFATKPIADKIDVLFDEETISDNRDNLFTAENVTEKQDDAMSEAPETKDEPQATEASKTAEESKTGKLSVPMLDDLIDLDNQIADRPSADKKQETPSTDSDKSAKPVEKPKDTFDDTIDIEMVDFKSLNVNHVTDNGAGDTGTPSERLKDDSADQVKAVDLNAPKTTPTVNIDQFDSLDDLFSVETVPEKVKAKVETVKEKIVSGQADDAESLFESETITANSRTAPLPNLDPKATTPLEKQDMSAQSKVSKAYDALFEEDEA